MVKLNEKNTRNFSPSCESNKDIILSTLTPYLRSAKQVLEVGSYSGQHALHICEHIPHLIWQPTDQQHYLDALTDNISKHNIVNIQKPQVLNVTNASHWPSKKFDFVFSANTIHIMSEQHVINFFKYLPMSISSGSILAIYGPFTYQGKYTSPSNEEFQQWLLDRDPNSGIKSFEQMNELAEQSGLTLLADIDMPANNQLLLWTLP